jgi:hypothetical protein
MSSKRPASKAAVHALAEGAAELGIGVDALLAAKSACETA